MRLVQLVVDKRHEAGMSQADLAEALGRYQSVVAAIESGGRRVDVVEFLELAEVIGFNPYEVLREVAETVQPKKAERKPS